MQNSENFNKALCASVHTVEAGETLYMLSKKYGVDYRRLMTLNHITNPHNIQIGQEICIPPAIEGGQTSGQNRPPKPGTRPTPHPGRPPVPGRPVGGPGPIIGGSGSGYRPMPGGPGNNTRPTPPPGTNRPVTYHIIQSGETLYGISKLYDITLSQLMEANADIDPYNLHIGMRLVIPAAGSQESTGTAAPIPQTTMVSDSNDSTGVMQTPTQNAGTSAAQTQNTNTIQMPNQTRSNIVSGSQTQNQNMETAAGTNVENTYVTPSGSTVNTAADSSAGTIADTQIDYSHNSGGSTVPDNTYSFGMSSDNYTLTDARRELQQYQQTQRSLPVTPYVSDRSADGIMYPVSDGENLTSVLSKFGICYAALSNENPGADLSAHIGGMTLCIPYEDRFRCSPINQPYTVKTGDTLAGISRQNHISTDELMRLNPTSNALDFSVAGRNIRVK